MARDLTFKLILDSLGFQRGAKAAGDALSKLGKDVKQTSSDMGPLGQGMDWLGSLATKLSSPVGIATTAIAALGGGALLAAKSVAALAAEAERLDNMAKKTGISADALQRLGRTAENMGQSLDSVAGAVNKMQMNLAKGAKDFEKFGLNVDHLLSLHPEQAFAEIARQIAATDDPIRRAGIGSAAFGRSWAEILPLLLKVGTEGTDAIVTLSQGQIEALKKIDDQLDETAGSWKDFKTQLTAAVGAAGGSSFLDGVTIQLRGIAQILKEEGFRGLIGAFASGFSGPFPGFGAGLTAAMAGARASVVPTSALGPNGYILGGTAALMEGDLWSGLSHEENKKALKELNGESRDAARITRELAKATKERAQYEAALRGQTIQLGLAADELNRHFATTAPTFTKASEMIGKSDMDALSAFLGPGPEMGFTMLGTNVQWAKDKSVEWSNTLTALASQLQFLGDVTGGLTGKVAQFAASLAGGLGSAMAGMETLQKGKSAGGIMGALGQVTGIAGIAASALGIGKAIVNLFKGDPVKKAQKEAGKALGFGISKEMAEAFAKTAKEQGKSIQAVAREWLAAQQAELRKTGLAQAKSGVEGLMGLLGTSPEITAIAAKNFATLFFETVKDEGWVAASDSFREIFEKLKAHFGENMPASLQGVARMMALSANPAVSPYLQAATAQGQFVGGAMQAGFFDASMQGDSVAIAKETLNKLRENGATDHEGYQALASLLQANVNAAIASGRGISSELQALLDEAKANGIDIVADINVQQLDVLRAIYKQLGGTGTEGGASNGGKAYTGEGVPEFASGGMIDAGRGRLAMLHGKEIITPANRVGGGMTIIINRSLGTTKETEYAFDKRVERVVKRALRHNATMQHDARVAVNGGR
jgi:hypothetical protein